MAKPFMLPESGPGGGSSSSGAGPPTNAPSNSSTGAGSTAPNTPAPIGTGSAASVNGSGAPGHIPSAPIPVAGTNSSQQYHLQQLHHHHQQLQQHYQSYQGWHGALLTVPGSSVIGGSLPVESHLMMPMTPPASGFATAVQTPQMAPVNEQLVQALYEAIHRCSLGDGPPTPLSQSPPSASCSPFANGGYYGSGQVFFPRTPAHTNGGRNGARVFFQQTPTLPYTQMPPSQPTPGSATSHSSSSGISSSLDTPSCSSGTPHYHQGHQLQPIQFNWQDDGDSSESEGSTSQATSSSGCSPHCLGMDGGASSSFGSIPSSSTLISPSSSGGTLYAAVPPHLDYMAGREQLQEFPGKIPQRKRKPRTPKPKKARLMEQPLMWQVAFTAAALIVLGCGYLAAR
ncbi:secreted protein C-like [Anopheles funestus]|uniref:secreted protein C-like n=1 Tax=Anopheles funestus TaxID=62324 RepID=UPI0020C6F2B8|nr:secreted protein C-like [Anopheles funestus]